MPKPLSLGLFLNAVIGATALPLATPPPGTAFLGTGGLLLYGANGTMAALGGARSTDVATTFGPIQAYDVSTPIVAVPGSTTARIRGFTKLLGASAAHPFPIRISTASAVTSRTLTTGSQLQAIDLSSPVTGVSFLLESDATTGEFNLLITFSATGAKRIIIECGGAVIQAAVTVT